MGKSKMLLLVLLTVFPAEVSLSQEKLKSPFLLSQNVARSIEAQKAAMALP